MTQTSHSFCTQMLHSMGWGCDVTHRRWQLTVCEKMNWVFKMAVYCGVLELSSSKVVNRWWVSCMLHIQALTEWRGLQGVISGGLGRTRKCPTCQEHRDAPVPALLHLWEFPEGLWKWIHVDYNGSFKAEILLWLLMPFPNGLKLPSWSRWHQQWTFRSWKRSLHSMGFWICWCLIMAQTLHQRSLLSSWGQMASFMWRQTRIILQAIDWQKGKEGITKTPADCIHTKIALFPVAVQDNSTINDWEESSRAAESVEIEDQTGLVAPKSARQGSDAAV